MDELLWGRGYSAPAVQHHPQSQILLVPHVLDQGTSVQEDEVQAARKHQDSGCKFVPFWRLDPWSQRTWVLIVCHVMCVQRRAAENLRINHQYQVNVQQNQSSVPRVRTVLGCFSVQTRCFVCGCCRRFWETWWNVTWLPWSEMPRLRKAWRKRISRCAAPTEQTMKTASCYTLLQNICLNVDYECKYMSV